jgi:holo-[acyl-carrier protein] synthase
LLSKSSRYYIGIDIVEISQIAYALSRWGNLFLRRIYTANEIRDYGNSAPSLAARFAAKEAVIKAFNGQIEGLTFKDIEILSDDKGIPYVQLHGAALEISKLLCINGFSISLSHSSENAIAFVIGNTLT